MRWHVRLLVSCLAAAFLAGCTTSDRPTEPATQTSATAPNFTEIPPGTACMGDFIWNDLNCDGVQDEGEPGLGGVVVKLYECPSGVLIDETVSEPNGYYALFGPAPDDYYIVVELPGENCSFSPANVGTPAGARDIGTDSDVDATGKGFCTNLHDQEIEKDMDAGICCEEVCDSYVGDRVFFDANCNGIQDKDETGVPGVTVKLINCEDESVAAETTTDDSGAYVLGPVEGGTYKVCVELLPGTAVSPKDQGENDGLDSDANEDGCTDCFELPCNETDNSRDIGLCEDGTGCRMTGGGVDTFGEWNGELSNGNCKRDMYTFGGQAGASTALQPQPKGEWEHNNHKGPSGSWAFHGGTSSASEGTEIDRIECSDPGFCNPARHAPAKQLDFWGVGEFSSVKEMSPLMGLYVVERESLHWFEVNVDDGGEPGNGNKGMHACPDDGFGLRGSVALVDCECPDFYRITIHATEDPSSPVIYQVWGYPKGGNLQIHPLTGHDLH